MSLTRDERRRAWRLLFHGDMTRETPTPLGQVILDELRAYCFGGFSTEATDAQGRIDPIRMAVNEGRRQVWLMIEHRLRAHENEVTDDDAASDE